MPSDVLLGFGRLELKISALRMLLVHAAIAKFASSDGGNFATNLPFIVIETEGPSISVLGSKVVLSVTPCCPSSQMMAACCSLYSPPETVSTVNIQRYLDSQGKSSKIGYWVQLPHSRSLLGLPSAPRFILNGPHADQSLGRNHLSKYGCALSKAYPRAHTQTRTFDSPRYSSLQH